MEKNYCVGPAGNPCPVTYSKYGADMNGVSYAHHETRNSNSRHGKWDAGGKRVDTMAFNNIGHKQRNVYIYIYILDMII